MVVPPSAVTSRMTSASQRGPTGTWGWPGARSAWTTKVSKAVVSPSRTSPPRWSMVQTPAVTRATITRARGSIGRRSVLSRWVQARRADLDRHPDVTRGRAARTLSIRRRTHCRSGSGRDAGRHPGRPGCRRSCHRRARRRPRETDPAQLSTARAAYPRPRCSATVSTPAQWAAADALTLAQIETARPATTTARIGCPATTSGRHSSRPPSSRSA